MVKYSSANCLVCHHQVVPALPEWQGQLLAALLGVTLTYVVVLYKAVYVYRFA